MLQPAAACPDLALIGDAVVTARVLVVAAHPDDETIGAGAFLGRCADAHVCVVTDGAPRDRTTWPDGVAVDAREDYARLRRDEVRRALGEAGIGPDRIHWLGFVDGETTNHLPTIATELQRVIARLEPAIVLTHACEGGHVDHDSTALAVHAALALAGRGHAHEMALYNGARDSLVVHEFLPGGPSARTLALDGEAADRKARMLAHYASQRQYACYFATEVERFRCAPSYDFRASPDPAHALLYERRAGEITGHAWRARAAAALQVLGLDHQARVERTSAMSAPSPIDALISVIVRSTGRPTLTRTLNSIAAQTHRPIEIVLVEVAGAPVDWSVPEGITVERRAAAGLDRPAAANAGLAAANGRYVAFLDDDDWYHPHHLHALGAALERTSDARVAYAAIEVVDDRAEGHPVRRWLYDRPFDAVALLAENYIPLNALLVDRTLLAGGTRFDETLPLYEDWDFLIGLSRRTRFLKVPGIGGAYRWPPGSGVDDPARTRELQARIVAKWRMRFSSEEYAALVARAVEQSELRDAHVARASELQRLLAGRDREMAALHAHLAAQDAELAQLRAHLSAQDAELAQLRPLVTAQDRQLGDLRAHLAAQDEELAALRPALSAVERDAEALRAAAAIREAELHALRADAARQTADIAQQEAARAVAERRLHEVQQSWSWRLTGPVRTLGALASGVSMGRLHARAVALKLRLAAGGDGGRRLVPIAETLEVLLGEGPAEVAVRVGRRMGRRKIEPPDTYSAPEPGAERGVIDLPAMTAEQGNVSIVIPVLNNAAVTHACLAALAAHTPAGRFEVIVVDNASDDETRRMLGRVKGLHVIANDANAGFVDACNQGAAAARGEFVLFLNNDTSVLPDWLEPLLRTLADHPSAGAVGARLLFPDGRLQEAGNIIWSDGAGWNYGKFEDPEAPEYGYVREVDYCSGACLLVRRELFARLGGFDRRYAPAYYEDTDFCFRLREHGYTVLYQPASRIVHLEGATAGRDEATGFKRHQAVNRETFLERHAAALALQPPHDPALLRRARDRRPGLRILVIDHMVPHHDQDSGSLRMATILRILTELGHAVSFLPDNLARVEPYTSELQQMGIEVLYGPMSSSRWITAHAATFDVVVLCRAYFAARHLPAVQGVDPRPVLIFDTVDLHHLREERQAALERDERLAAAAARTREVELAVTQACDRVWVTSPHEADVLRGFAVQRPIDLVPNVHEVRPATPGFESRRHLLFIGGFAHPPNVDAVVFFVSEVLPQVLRTMPDVHLQVVGSHVPPAIERLASAHVHILGYVPDAAPVFDSCRLSVAPLRYGAGVKGKITQSLAWGLPVVTTPIGAEGLGLVDREHAMIAADAAEMAAKIVEAYRDDVLWRRLAAQGRAHLQATLGYDAVRATIEEILRDVRAGRDARGAAGRPATRGV